MVTVTERAKEQLRRVLETTEIDPGKHLRLTTPPVWQGEGDFGIVIDQQLEEDYVVSSEGITLLLLDAGLVDHLSTAVLDFKDSAGGARFTLDVF